MKTGKLVISIVIVVMSSFSVALAADSWTVPFGFDIPRVVSLDIDKYNLDLGDITVLDEAWGPIGSDNSYKVNAVNNSGGAWEIRLNMLGDMLRQEGVVDAGKDIIKAENMRWTIVYAGYWNDEVTGHGMHEARYHGDEGNVPGLAADALIDNSVTEKGNGFTLGADPAGRFFRNVASNYFSYVYQFSFKFILKPPASTSPGTYRGTIVFTMVTQ